MARLCGVAALIGLMILLGSGKLWKATGQRLNVELSSPWHAKCRVLPACPLWTCAEALGLWASRSFFLHAVVVACLWVVHSLKAHLQPESMGGQSWTNRPLPTTRAVASQNTRHASFPEAIEVHNLRNSKLPKEPEEPAHIIHIRAS